VHRRPVSISILGGYMSIASAVMVFMAIRMVFLSEDPLYKQTDDGQTVMGSLPLFVGLGISVINFVCAVNILDGQNWARWIYTVTAVCQFVFQLEAFTHLSAVMWVSVCFRCMMIFFLFTADANEFFRNPL
jgi:hypothetical protein